MSATAVIRAYCYASGLIEFGSRVPKGAIVIARGPKKELRDFIEVMARHGYQTRVIGGRRTRVPGTDNLLVPGIPEAPDQWAAGTALKAWLKWIAVSPPKGVRVLSR